MEEHVYIIRSYLPVEFDDPEIKEFFDYLVSAYLENLANEKFQFSFTAFHMLYMSFIYKTKWLLKIEGNAKILESLDDFVKQNKGTSFNTLFDLSQFNEKTTLEKLLKTLSFHSNDVDLCKNLVEVRNKCSHASGKVYFKRSLQVENYILEELDNVFSIHRKISPHLKMLLENFLNKYWQSNWIISDLKEWVASNYFSQKDIETLLDIKLPLFRKDSDTAENVQKKLLYSVLVSEMAQYLDKETDYFLSSLRVLMVGLTASVDTRKDPRDAERLKSTQELIEEKILPVITSLSNIDAMKAQNILNLNPAA